MPRLVSAPARTRSSAVMAAVAASTARWTWARPAARLPRVTVGSSAGPPRRTRSDALEVAHPLPVRHGAGERVPLELGVAQHVVVDVVAEQRPGQPAVAPRLDGR